MPRPTAIHPDAYAHQDGVPQPHFCAGACGRFILWAFKLCWECREQRREDMLAERMRAAPNARADGRAGALDYGHYKIEA
jgi:hypothetical protein